MRRYLTLLTSMLFMKYLMSAYSGGLIGMFIESHQVLAFAFAGLVGHLSATAIEYAFCILKKGSGSVEPQEG